MKTLVTGANGFLGSHLVDRLIEDGHEVHVLVRKTSNLQWLLGKPVQFHYGDVSSASGGSGGGLKEGLRDVEIVFHVAGVIRARKPRTYYEVNARGTENVLEACLAVDPQTKKLKRVVVVTSLAAHGPRQDDRLSVEEDECQPLTDYGKSKRDAELIALKYRDRIPVTIIRPPAIYGPRDDQIFDFFRLVKRGVALLPGWGRGILNIAHVQDVVEGMILAANSPQAVGEIFFIGGDQNYTWHEVADSIGRAVNRKPFKISVPKLFIFGVSGAADILGRLTGQIFSLNLDYARNFVQKNWSMDVTKAKRLLSFQPKFSLDDGMRETVTWYVNEGWLET